MAQKSWCGSRTGPRSAGSTWAFATNANDYNTDTCNGHDYRTVNVTSSPAVAAYPSLKIR